MLKLGGEYSDDALKAIARLGDDLAEAGVKLSDEAAEGLGRIFRQAGDDAGERLVRAIGTDNPNLLKVLENAKAWDDVAAEGFGKLVKAGVDDKTLTNFLVKYADDPATSNNVLTILGKDPAKSAELLNRYGDDAVEMVAHYGDDGVEALSVFGVEARDLFQRFGDDELLGPYLRSVTADPKMAARLADLKNTVPPGMSLSQGFEVRRMMEEVGGGFDLHITGRWSNTPAEKVIRNEAAGKADELLAKFLRGETPLPEDVQDVIQDLRNNPGKYDVLPKDVEDEVRSIMSFTSKREVTKQYENLAWPQAKVSTGDIEVDVLIDVDVWNSMGSKVQDAIRDGLAEIFNVPPNKVDFYQRIAPPLWESLLSSRNPGKDIPPGSISFLSDGTVIKPLLGGLE